MGWLRGLGSLKFSVVLLAVLFLAVLAGTLAQAAWGASSVQTTFFARPLFEVGGWWVPGLPALLALLGLNLSAGAWVHLERSLRHLGLWMLHGALVLFCFGSLGLAAVQQELVLGLVPGATAQEGYVRNSASGESRPLPFSLTLESFRIETYPGSVEPSDYVSSLLVRGAGPEVVAEVRMNQPFRREGWTVYQSAVQVIEGQAAPVYKLMRQPVGWLPYAVSAQLAASLLVSLIARRRGPTRV